MKKKIWICSVLVFAVLCSGCAGATAGEPSGETSAGVRKPTPKPEKKEEIENPMEEVESAAAFEKLGANIEVPAGAKDARYYIVNDEIAEIQFVFNDAVYSYRASIEEEDLSGVCDEAAEGKDSKFTVGEKEIVIEMMENGGYLTQWEYEPVHYSLYTADEVEEAVIQALVREMVLDTASIALDTI